MPRGVPDQEKPVRQQGEMPEGRESGAAEVGAEEGEDMMMLLVVMM